MSGTALKRVVVKQWIVAEMLKHERAGGSRRMTAAQIAKKTDRKPSTKFRQILAEMAFNGTLIIHREYLKTNVSDVRFLYELNPKKYPPHVEPARVIKVNGATMQLAWR